MSSLHFSLERKKQKRKKVKKYTRLGLYIQACRVRKKKKERKKR
jgi:hypothetical protein